MARSAGNIIDGILPCVFSFKYQNISPQLSSTSGFFFSVAAVTSMSCGFFALWPSSAHAFVPLFPLWHCISHMDATWSQNSTTNLVSQLRGGSGTSQDLFFSTGALPRGKAGYKPMTLTQMKPELSESQVYRNQDLTFSLAKIQAAYLLCLNAAWQNLQTGRNFPVKTCLLHYLLILNISLLFELINTLKGDS